MIQYEGRRIHARCSSEEDLVKLVGFKNLIENNLENCGMKQRKKFKMQQNKKRK